VFTFKDLSNTSENDAVWKFLKSDTVRARVFDLILDLAFEKQKADTDVLHPDALRASAARIEFAKNLNDLMPKSPEQTKARKPILPQPVE
jgi:hypothetical protein